MTTDQTSPHHDPLDAVIAAYIQQVEAGAQTPLGIAAAGR